jgi:ribosomal protein L30E
MMVTLCMCLLLVGCASNGKVVAANNKPALSGKVGTVKVLVDYDNIASERHEVIKKYEVVSRLKNGVLDQLKAQNKYQSGGQVDLRILLTGFRLRSGSSAFWLGAMAGKDFASVNVDVIDNGNKVHSYSTDSSTLLGGIIKPAPSQRVNSVCKEVSKRIVSQL